VRKQWVDIFRERLSLETGGLTATGNRTYVISCIQLDSTLRAKPQLSEYSPLQELAGKENIEFCIQILNFYEKVNYIPENRPFVT
jgi:hypothetical protein